MRRLLLKRLHILIFAQALVAVAQPLQPLETSPPSVLKPSSLLQEKVAPNVRAQLPSFIQADRLEGEPDQDLLLQGSVVFRRGDTLLRADRVDYSQATDRLKAQGHVSINRAGTVYTGPELDLKINTFEGFFTQPTYRFLKNQAYGQASKIEFIDDQRAVIHNATFTTCQRKPGPSWMPDWVLKASRMDINSETQVGQAEGASLRLKDIPILPIPSLSFPLSAERKSGFLPPTLGLDNLSGIEYTQPYYWNIAPNRDATLQTTLWSKRGLNLGGEFRYLESAAPDYRGQIRMDYMMNDPMRDRNRWGYAQTHAGWAPWGDGKWGLNLNLNRVSDDNYWRDFPRASGSLTQRLLPADAQMTWLHGTTATTFRAVKWQTLQDVTAPIVPPYDRMPQLITRHRSASPWLDLSLEAEYTRFEADRALVCSRMTTLTRECLQPNADRAFAVTRLAHPFQGSWGTLTPKMALHTRAYQFDTPFEGQRSASVTVPTFSLDATTVLERTTQLRGASWIQTLEPRAFFVSTPYRDQNSLPIYDTGRNDFNFATVFTENPFSGQDRLADNQLLTLGLTSRLVHPETGVEGARFGIAQRLRMKDQRVVLPTETGPVSERVSDVLMGATVNLNPAWMLDSTVQYNPKTERSIRSVAGVRYNPSNYRLISTAYRFQRDVNSKVLDTAWQWPLNDLWGDKGQDSGPGRGLGEDRWYAVGRLNYNLQERKMVDAIVGLEYDAGCWLSRLVFERLQVASTQANQRIMFQLEFVGFTRVGSNPLRHLKENIPRYQYLRDQVAPPSRFGAYD
jgi:LPS-assembly protein